MEHQKIAAVLRGLDVGDMVEELQTQEKVFGELVLKDVEPLQSIYFFRVKDSNVPVQVTVEFFPVGVVGVKTERYGKVTKIKA